MIKFPNNCFAICGLDWFMQWFVVITAGLGGMCIGLSNGWMSPSIPLLVSADSPIPLQESQVSLVANVTMVATLFTVPVAAIITNKIGRKRSIQLACSVQVVAWFIISQASQVWHLVVARGILGIGIGGFIVVPGYYVGEIVQDKQRGAAMGLFSIIFQLGFLLAFIAGPYVSFYTLAYICLCVPLCTVIFALFTPESPFFYIMQKDDARAVETLQALRGKEDVTAEFTKIKEFIENKKETEKSMWAIFKYRHNLKALGITVGLLVAQQLTGCLTFLMYSQTIFEKAGDGPVSPAIATIFVGLTFVSFMVVAVFTVDKFGRKIVLLVSCAGSIVALTLEGIYFFMKDVEQADVSAFSWCTLVMMILLNMFQSFGLNVVPSIYFTELFGADIKSKAIILLSCTLTIFGFLGSEMFLLVFNNWDMYIIFWIFAGMCVLSMVFTIVFVPETKGMSFNEIQEFLRK